MAPRVSCIVTCHDQERFAPLAIESVLAQDHPRELLEIIVVDDGSTDGTVAAIEPYRDRVRLIEQDNRGHIEAYNTGIAAATGDYIALLDGDDEWLPDKVRRQVALLEADPGLGLVYGDVETIDEHGRLIAPSFQADLGIETRRGRREASGMLMVYNFAQTSTIMARASLREHFHPIPAWGRAQDWWLALRTSMVAAIAPTGGVVARYRRHDANILFGVDPARKAAMQAREIPVRRWALRHASPETIDLTDLPRAVRELDKIVAQASAGTGRRATELAPDRPEAGEAAWRLLSRAVGAHRRGDHATACYAAVQVLSDFPRDSAARAVLDRALHALAGVDLPAPDAPPQAAGDLLASARAFVTAAFADELVADPALLRSYAEAFGPGDDATLAIHTAAPTPDAAVAELTGALEAAGIDPDAGPDLLLAWDPDPEAAEAAVARASHAVLGERRPPARFEALPRHRAGDADLLLARARERWALAPAGRPLEVGITICAPDWRQAPFWGDLHFARGLAEALERRGHRAHVLPVSHWESETARACDAVIALRGLHAYVPRPEQHNVLWVISHPELVGAAECDAYDAAFAASAAFARRLSQTTARPVGVLEQATDPRVFFPEHSSEFDRDVMFVGNSRGVMRTSLAHLLPTAHDVAIYGGGWEGLVDRALVVAPRLENQRVRQAYTSARVVLNDHWDDMRDEGFASNRIYDALACGAVLVSDDVAELDPRLRDALAVYGDRAELRAHVDRLVADPAARDALRLRGRAIVLAEHTFDHRAGAILEALAGCLGARPAAVAA